MKNIYARLILTIFLTLVLQGIIFSQACFIQLSDATGIEYTQEQLDSLEAAACELVQTLPTQFQNDFKVYDIGFYRYNADMVGGVEAVWDRIISEIPTEYYLIFGRQIDKLNNETTFLFDINLPTSGSFSCYDSEFYNKVKFKIRHAANSQYMKINISSLQYSQVEISGMEELKSWILTMIECCDSGASYQHNECSLCAWKVTDILQFYEALKFQKDSCMISQGNLQIDDSSCICSFNYNIELQHYINPNIEVTQVSFIHELTYNEEVITIDNIYNFLIKFGEKFASNNKRFYAAITDQSIFCTDAPSARTEGRKVQNTIVNIDQIETKFKASEIGIWISLLYTSSESYIAIKTKGVDVSLIQWALPFSAKYDSSDEIVDYIKTINQMRKFDPYIRLDRSEELYNLVVQNPHALLRDCMQENNIDPQDYIDLFNHSLPQSCIERLDTLGDGFYYQNLDNAHSPTVNMDYYSVEIFINPDFDNDGAEDNNNTLFYKIRENFLDLASGSDESFNSYCIFGGAPNIWWEFKDYPGLTPSSSAQWLGNHPISTIFLIDAGGSGIATLVADLGAVIVSDMTGSCWVFSTIVTPESGSQPFSGHRQFGLRSNSNGNLEFFTRAVDRVKLPRLMKALLINDVCSYKDYYEIGDATWYNLMNEVTQFILNNGGAAAMNRRDHIRLNYEEIKQVLKSNSPIDINCN